MLTWSCTLIVTDAEGKHVMDGTKILLRLKQIGASELQDPTTVSGKETRRLQITGLAFLSDLLAMRISQVCIV